MIPRSSRQATRLSGLVLVSLTFLSSGPIHAADSPRFLQSCDEASLREALSSDGTVLCRCSGTIVLTQPITLSHNVVLDGVGQDVLLSGGNSTRHFVIQAGASLTLRSITLMDGLASGTNGAALSKGGAGEGGAVLNQGGSFVAMNSTFLHDRAIGGDGGAGGSGFFDAPGAGGVGRGGVIFNQGGEISLTDCLLQANQALGGRGGVGVAESVGGESAGGAIFSTGGHVVLQNCTFQSNRSISGRGQRSGALRESGAASGGAIEIGAGNLEIVASRFNDSESRADYGATARGGAVTQLGGSLSIVGSYLQRNTARAGFGLAVSTPLGRPGGHASGGGLFLSATQVGITNSTLFGNLAIGGGQQSGGTPGDGSGGGIFSSGPMTLLNSTLVQNEASGGENLPGGLTGKAIGGGIYNLGGTASVLYSTIVSNTARAAVFEPGLLQTQLGAAIASSNGSLTLNHSIVAHSRVGSNCYGTILDAGHNLSSDASGGFNASGSLNNVDPVLSPLADHGGGTPSMAPLAGSPALNAGDPSGCPTTDQRGRARPFGASCDIGAFESSPPYMIRGVVTGPRVIQGLRLSASESEAETTQTGNFALGGLGSGQHLVVPSAIGFFFHPTNMTLSVGPDIIGTSFRAFQINSLEINAPTPEGIPVTYVGIAGNSVTIQSSADPSSNDWTSLHTDTIPPGGLLEKLEPAAVAQPGRYLRAIRP